VRGAGNAARFLQLARGARPAIVDGVPAAVWVPGGELRAVFRFTISGERITTVDAVANEEDLRRIDFVVTDRRSAT
jgi:hypothetical protein